MTVVSNLRADPNSPLAPLRNYIDKIAADNKEYWYPGQKKDHLFSSLYTILPPMPLVIPVMLATSFRAKANRMTSREYTMESLHRGTAS